MAQGHGATIFVAVLIILIFIAYAIFLFVMFREKRFIFAPYVPHPDPSKTVFPLGNVTELTPDEQQARKQLITGGGTGVSETPATT